MKTNCREYMVDSGAGQSSLTSEERQTKKATDKDFSFQTANGIEEVMGKAEVYINEVDTDVYVKLVEGWPTVFSLGRYRNEMGHLNT